LISANGRQGQFFPIFRMLQGLASSFSRAPWFFLCAWPRIAILSGLAFCCRAGGYRIQTALIKAGLNGFTGRMKSMVEATDPHH
jgi:hypothetical protein